MPGQPARARARFRKTPRQFTLENCRLPLARPQIIRRAQEFSRFAEPTLGQFVAHRNKKNFAACEEAVEDWHSLWKLAENAQKFSSRGASYKKVIKTVWIRDTHVPNNSRIFSAR
jgi:hypothetical protein